MADSRNISDILQDWDYDSQSIRARIVAGQNGEADVLQMRVEMGVIQMAVDGRPDGIEARVRGVQALEDQARRDDRHVARARLSAAGAALLARCACVCSGRAWRTIGPCGTGRR